MAVSRGWQTSPAPRTASRATIGRRARRAFAHHAAAYLFLLPAIIVFALFAWYPILKGFALSFEHYQNNNVGLPAHWVGLDNYRALFADPSLNFGAVWLNTLQFTLYALALGYIIPLGLAMMINEIRQGRALFRVAFYMPVILPTIVSMFIWQKALYDPDPNGFLNEVLGWLRIGPQPWIADQGQAMICLVVAATWAAAGGTMLIYLAALQGVPAHLYEAAEMDGAGLWRRLYHITLPRIRVIMLIMLLLQIIATMQIFTEPWSLTGGGPVGETTTVMVTLYNTAFGSNGGAQDFGQASAIGVLLFCALGLFSGLYFLVTRRFSQ
ncbi:MAG TPA: sugar ABC transporter permease [Chloroflexota bacterium]|nr:sugar ABC transporter permease [Chloroflexota bacterium]